MSSWTGFTPKPPASVIDSLNAVVAIIGKVESTLDVLQNILNLVKKFKTVGSDPLGAITESLVTEVTNLIEDLGNTGAYMINIAPPPISFVNPVDRPFGYSNFIQKLYTSFDDTYDTNRPTFTGHVGALILLVGVAGIKTVQTSTQIVTGYSQYKDKGNAFLAAYRALIGLFSFNIRETGIEYRNDRKNIKSETQRFYEEYESRINEIINKPLNNPPDTSVIFTDILGQKTPLKTGTPPNWFAVRLRDLVPGVAQLEDVLLKAVSTLGKGFSAIEDEFVAIINIIDRKITQLRAILDEAEQLIAALQAILTVSGIYYIVVESDDGIDGLRREISISTNKPPYGSDSLCGGTVLLAGTGNFEKLKTFFIG